jgi:hypothetical protein
LFNQAVAVFGRFAGVFLLLLLQACAGLQEGGSDTLVLEDGTVFTGFETEKPEVQKALLAQFREWRGTPYKLGGNSKAGIDCSAFVQQTLNTHFNITAPRHHPTSQYGCRCRPRCHASRRPCIFPNRVYHQARGLLLGRWKIFACLHEGGCHHQPA